MIRLSREVGEAIRSRGPVVALETTLVAHGFPPGEGIAVALESERRVREAGALPATVGVLDGKVRVGLGEAELERFTIDARETDHGIAPSLATHRAAASAASSGPPTRNPAASASPAPVVSTTSAGAAGTSRPSTVKPAAPRFATTLRAGGSGT